MFAVRRSVLTGCKDFSKPFQQAFSQKVFETKKDKIDYDRDHFEETNILDPIGHNDQALQDKQARDRRLREQNDVPIFTTQEITVMTNCKFRGTSFSHGDDSGWDDD